MTLSHLTLTVSDLEAAKKFYLAALAPLGYEEIKAIPNMYGLGANGIPDFWIGNGYNPEGVKSKEPLRGLHVAFRVEKRELVHQFYEAALKAGGTDNGAPGPRPWYENYYAAFVLDADRNNVEVVCFNNPDA